MHVKKKIVTIPYLLELRAGWRVQNKQVVLCQGCFDLLHRGHVHLLTEARKLGDVLVVAVNDDKSTKGLKGAIRPIVSSEDRAVLLSALDCTDFIVIFDSCDARGLVANLQPNIYVDDDVRNHQTVEAGIVAEYGGQLAIIQRLQGYSTTGLIQQIGGVSAMHIEDSYREDSLFQSPKKHILPNVGYFRLETHELLLRDNIRVEGLQKAINAVVRPGDIVLDLGTGTGLLAFFACQSGAQHVYAIEKEQIIELAILIARHNGYHDKIEFISGNSNDVDVPQQVDILVSECLGSFGLNTMMISDFFRARDKFLKPNGSVIPASMSLFVAPFASEMFSAEMSFWKTTKYGIDFSSIETIANNQVYMVFLTDCHLLASPHLIHGVDFYSDDDAIFTTEICMTIEISGLLAGICGWFDVELAEGVRISTSPSAPPTSWYQVVFPLRYSDSVIPGDQLFFRLSNEYQPPLITWNWDITLMRNGKMILHESYSSRDGFPQYPIGMTTTYYSSF